MRPLNVAEWVSYLRDLEALLKTTIGEEQWEMLFKRTDTPVEAAEKLAAYSPIDSPERKS